jgi:hypothetical protein
MNRQDMDDLGVSEGLRDLRASVQELGAGERVEAALVEAFRKERARPARRPARWWPKWALAAAAIVIITAGMVVLLRRAETLPSPVATVPPAAAKADVVEPPAPPPPRVEVQAATAPAVAGEFIPLVPDLAWGPGESAQILRVSMPRSALQSFGLPVNEDRAFETVRADIVVGQDMVARAIRIVR